MDNLINDLKIVSEQIIPILGAVALIFLCVALKKLANLLDKVKETVENVNPTIKLVDQSINKIQAPLDTAVKLSHTVDNVHDKTVEGVNKASTFIRENSEGIKNSINDTVNKFKSKMNK